VAGTIVADEKKALRAQILVARDALSADAQRTCATQITRQLLELDAYRNASCVLAYMSFGSEFDTGALVADALAHGKRLCLPRVDRTTQNIEIHHVENLERDLQANSWGIREPRVDCARADLDKIDFVLVPGVAFTPRCERMGYGRGYYDRLIARFAQRPPLVAAAFELQVRDAIPLTARDQRVDIVITEKSFYCNC
jgi:5-formyltetrahydrofolate cyclo-ligase